MIWTHRLRKHRSDANSVCCRRSSSDCQSWRNGDVVGALPKVLRAMGHDVRIFMPYYGFLPDKMAIPKEPVWYSSAMFQSFAVFEAVLPGTDVPLYLFSHAAFSPRHLLWEDEDWRFTLFANGAGSAGITGQKLSIADWHTGMIPVWMHQSSDISSVFTIPVPIKDRGWWNYLVSLVCGA